MTRSILDTCLTRIFKNYYNDPEKICVIYTNTSHLTYPLSSISVIRNGLHILPRLPSCFCPFLFNRLPSSGFWSLSSSSFSLGRPSHCYVAVALLVLSWSIRLPSMLLHPFTHRFHVCFSRATGLNYHTASLTSLITIVF